MEVLIALETADGYLMETADGYPLTTFINFNGFDFPLTTVIFPRIYTTRIDQ